MNIFEWIRNKKQLEEQMEKDDKLIDKLRSENAKLNANLKEKEIEVEKINDYLMTIKEQRKEIRKLKKELKGDK